MPAISTIHTLEHNPENPGVLEAEWTGEGAQEPRDACNAINERGDCETLVDSRLSADRVEWDPGHQRVGIGIINVYTSYQQTNDRTKG